MKGIELRLIAELMKNSRRSDRELAKALGVSQPTIGRTIRKLEKEGYIKEYTMIPDFAKLGFEIMSVVFIKLNKEDPNTIEGIRKDLRGQIKEKPRAMLLAMKGLGEKTNRMNITFYQNYSEYSDSREFLKQHPSANVEESSTFIISLRDQDHYQSLTLSEIARYLEKMEKKE